MKDVWPEVRLADVLIQVSRPTTPDVSRSYRLLGIRLDGNGAFHRETVTGAETSASRLFEVRDGDFIYSRLFAWRGAFGLVSAELSGAHVSSEFPTFRASDQRLDERFLYLWFKLPDTLKRVEAECSGSTPLTRNRFKEKFFLDLKIPLPTIGEQRRIVEYIETVAEKVEGAKTLAGEADSAARTLLSQAFWGIARDALRKPMSQVAPLVRRPIKVVPDGSYSELGIRSFGKGTFHKRALSGLEVGTKRIFAINPGDLLFSNVFAWEGAIAVARTEDANRCGSHRFISCLPYREIATAEYLCFFFLTEQGLALIGEASPGGAGRNRTLGLEALNKIEVPVPSIQQQQWFGKLLKVSSAQKHERVSSTVALDALVPAVLHKAFSGSVQR